MSTHGFFVLGTDTNVGKTVFTMSLLAGLKAKGYSTIGLKPVASGSQLTSEGLRNADALNLQKAASIALDYERVNPFCFEAPIAPHIAASLQNCFLRVGSILEACQTTLNYPADYCVIEGIGGIYVPLNKKETFIDLVRVIDFPIILVVGLRLGCLNQALLTWKCLHADRLKVVGWVANQLDPEMKCVHENVDFLRSFLPVPCLGFIPFAENINACDFSSLIDYKILCV